MVYEYDVKGCLLGVQVFDSSGVCCEYDVEDQFIIYLDEVGVCICLQYVGIGQIGKCVQVDGYVVEYCYDIEE